MTMRFIKHLRGHAVAYLALFLTLTAGGYAATTKKKPKKVRIPPNSIGTGKLKDNAVKEKKIATGAVTREKLDVKLPVPEAVGNIVYTTDTPTVKQGSSGITGVTEATGGVDGFVCVDTAKTVTVAVGNATDASKFISTATPAGGTCPTTADILVTVNQDNATQTKGSFSLIAY